MSYYDLTWFKYIFIRLSLAINKTTTSNAQERNNSMVEYFIVISHFMKRS